MDAFVYATGATVIVAFFVAVAALLCLLVFDACQVTLFTYRVVRACGYKSGTSRPNKVKAWFALWRRIYANRPDHYYGDDWVIAWPGPRL